MEKIKNLSLKKTIILYMVISLICTFFLSAFVARTTMKVQEKIWLKYIDEEKYYEATKEYNNEFWVNVSRPNQYDMSEMDRILNEICDFLQTYSVLVFSVAGSCIAVGLFYRNKLKRPIAELGKASEMIAQDELDFCVDYHNKDEMGQLCEQFEKMRVQLAENNKTLWQMVEEEKALRAAIAHDIRSPLSVLRGYQEMLLEFVPEETFDKEKTTEILQEGMTQIDRMNHFIETMRKMTSLEQREIRRKKINLKMLGDKIKEETKILSKDTGKECIVSVLESHKDVYVDLEVLLEVTENLLSNALRYANRKIEIVLTCRNEELEISVADDGNGFTENQETLTEAFYHSNPQDDLQHFGMGMYISRIYCERHGGRLLLGNDEQGGASAKAIFKIK